MSLILMFTVSVISGLALLSITLVLVCHGCAHRALSRRVPLGTWMPPVTILKPLKGIDDGLFENLCSFAEQRYPEYEIIFGTEDASDPALRVVDALRERYPQVPIRVVVGQAQVGLNPKVNNLARLSAVARYEYWLVSDSNVQVDPEYLSRVAAEFQDERVGLVTNLIAGTGERVLGALLENLHLNSFVVGCVMGVPRLTGHVCVVGKSMLFRRRDLNALGGFAEFAKYLAEDYWFGRRFAEAGWRVVTSCHVIRTVNRSWSLRRFLARHLRWAQMRRRIWLAAYFAELLTNPTPWLLALGGIACVGTMPQDKQHQLLLFACGGLFLKLLSDGWMTARLRQEPVKLGLLWVPFKDLLILGIWVIGLFKQTTEWRGTVVRLGPGSLLLPPESLATNVNMQPSAAVTPSSSIA